MRILGIDFGDVNIGIAVSDEGEVLASPFCNLKNNRKVLLEIKDICEKEAIKKVVVGLPIGFSRQENAQSKIVRVFTEKLQKVLSDMEIVFEDELFSTSIAEKNQYRKMKEPADKNAAAVILQSYLDRKDC